MKLKYPIHYSVEVASNYANETKSLTNGFSRFSYTSGPASEKPSTTTNLKTAIKHAKKHGGSVVAYYLEDKPMDYPEGSIMAEKAKLMGYRHNTYGRKTVFGEAVLPDRSYGNAMPSELASI